MPINLISSVCIVFLQMKEQAISLMKRNNSNNEDLKLDP